MPKATLEFDLPAEQAELEAAITGAEARAVITGMQAWLDNQLHAATLKRGDGRTPDDYTRAVQDARAALLMLLDGPIAKEPPERHERDDDG